VTISPYLAISTEQRGQQLVLRLRGELDVSNADSLRQVLDGVLERASQTLVVDLARLGFADRAGLTVLVAARTRLAAQGHQLIMINAQPVVRRLLAVTGLDTVFRLNDPDGPESDPPQRLPHERHRGPSGSGGGHVSEPCRKGRPSAGPGFRLILTRTVVPPGPLRISVRSQSWLTTCKP
jgi:anti-sigma B factor antagonist